MNKQAPYHSALLNKTLHAILNNMDGMRYSTHEAAFKNVALVGMLLPNTQAVKNGNITPDEIYREDSAMLRRSFQALSKAGIPLHPEASFHVYNIQPPVRSDFLLAAMGDTDLNYPKSDLSILLYLPKYGTTPNDRNYRGHRGFQSYDTQELYGVESWRQFTAASHLHHEFHIWAEAADNLGSQIVLTHGGINDEITTKHFKGHHAFKTLIDSEENARKNNVSDRHNMGVLVRADAVERLTKQIKPDSEIGQALSAEIS